MILSYAPMSNNINKNEESDDFHFDRLPLNIIIELGTARTPPIDVDEGNRIFDRLIDGAMKVNEFIQDSPETDFSFDELRTTFYVHSSLYVQGYDEALKVLPILWHDLVFQVQHLVELAKPQQDKSLWQYLQKRLDEEKLSGETHVGYYYDACRIKHLWSKSSLSTWVDALEDDPPNKDKGHEM